jgi:hypothetical protein
MMVDTNAYIDDFHAARIHCQRRCDGEFTEGIVFAHVRRLLNLRTNGDLSLMDATHGTNIADWPLYTLFCRTSENKWIPAAHFYTATEDGDIVTQALIKIREWCGDVGGWRCRFFLTDDSSAEQRGVCVAWTLDDTDGPDPLDLAPEHFLCTVHLDRTLLEHFGARIYEATLAEMRAALYARTTKAKCIESIEKAIAALPDNAMKEKNERYIRNQWLNCTATVLSL